MYKQHCLGTIAPAMAADMEVFRRGVMFAVCSIRQPVTSVPGQLGILFDGAEEESPLFGHKFEAWAWISDNSKCALLWKKLCLFLALKDTLRDRPTRSATSAALMAMMEIPGLGIVKSAFVLQLMGFDIACLDGRNVQREKRNPRAYRTDGKPPAKLTWKINAYLDEVFGKAELYWDDWCRFVAADYGMLPNDVSALHLAIVPENHIPF